MENFKLRLQELDEKIEHVFTRIQKNSNPSTFVLNADIAADMKELEVLKEEKAKLLAQGGRNGSN